MIVNGIIFYNFHIWCHCFYIFSHHIDFCIIFLLLLERYRILCKMQYQNGAKLTRISCFIEAFKQNAVLWPGHFDPSVLGLRQSMGLASPRYIYMHARCSSGCDAMIRTIVHNGWGKASDSVLMIPLKALNVWYVYNHPPLLENVADNFAIHLNR